MAITLQIRSKGTIIIPADIRNKYRLKEGEVLDIIDLGNGSFLISSRRSRVDELADKIRAEAEGLK